MPSTRSVPPLGAVSPEINFNTVDFPQPDGPISVTNSSLSTQRSMASRTARAFPYCLLTLVISIIGATSPEFMLHLHSPVAQVLSPVPLRIRPGSHPREREGTTR